MCVCWWVGRLQRQIYEEVQFYQLVISFYNRFVIETEKLSSQLQNEFDLITQFYDELYDLQLWMSDTLSMLQLSATTGQTSSANGTTSVSQLRGKHQVRIGTQPLPPTPPPPPNRPPTTTTAISHQIFTPTTQQISV